MLNFRILWIFFMNIDDKYLSEKNGSHRFTGREIAHRVSTQPEAHANVCCIAMVTRATHWADIYCLIKDVLKEASFSLVEFYFGGIFHQWLGTGWVKPAASKALVSMAPEHLQLQGCPNFQKFP